jgi:hypothetical protein
LVEVIMKFVAKQIGQTFDKNAKQEGGQLTWAVDKTK